MPNFVYLCVYVFMYTESSLGMPEGSARRACPAEVPKITDRMPPWLLEGRGEGPPKMKFPTTLYFLINFSRRGHCGRSPGGGSPAPPPYKISSTKFFPLIFPDGANAAAGYQGVLEEGEGGGFPPNKMFPKMFFPQNFFPN